MKRFNNSLIRSITALLLGLLLILYPEHLGSMLVVFVGVLFFLPGLISLIGSLKGQRFKVKEKPSFREGGRKSIFSVLSVGSMLFGLWLIIMPEFFIGILLILLGVVLVAGGMQQIIMLFAANRVYTVSIYLYIMPVLLLISGFIVLINPFGVMRTGFLFVGICCLFYGIMVLINIYFFRSIHITDKTEIQDADIIDD